MHFQTSRISIKSSIITVYNLNEYVRNGNEYVWINGGEISGFGVERPSLKGKIKLLNKFYIAHRVSKIVMYRIMLKIIHKIA